VAVFEGAQDGVAPEKALTLLQLGRHAAMLLEGLEDDEDAHAGEDQGANQHIHAMPTKRLEEEDEPRTGEQVATHAGALAGP